MGRDVFPYPADREVLDGFLTGKGASYSSDSTIAWTQGRLRMVEGLDLLWFAPDGSLTAMIGVSIAGGQTVRVINYACEALGLPDDMRIEREPTEVGKGARYTFDGSYIDVGQAFVIAGPVSIAAWRASLSVPVRRPCSIPQP